MALFGFVMGIVVARVMPPLLPLLFIILVGLDNTHNVKVGEELA